MTIKKGNLKFKYLSKAAECTIYTSKYCGKYCIPNLTVHEVHLQRDGPKNKNQQKHNVGEDEEQCWT